MFGFSLCSPCAAPCVLVLLCVGALFSGACTPDESAAICVETNNGQTVIQGVPRGLDGDVDWFGQSVALSLQAVGVGTDYTTVMGDSGVAFLMPAFETGPLLDENDQVVGQAPEDLGKVPGRRDVGWWPIAPEPCVPRVEFVGQAAGRKLRLIGSADWPGDDGKAKRYAEMRTDIEASISQGRPVAVVTPCWQVAVGFNADGKVLAFCPAGMAEEPCRLMDFIPWMAVAPGEPIDKLDRRQADQQALQYAVALAANEANLPGACLSGAKAYALWVAELRQITPPGQARWHENVVYTLTLRRGQAIAYLEAMATRHSSDVQTHLAAAVQQYRSAVELLKTADTSPAAMTSAQGRETLAALAERLSQLDALAAAELQQAVDAMR